MHFVKIWNFVTYLKRFEHNIDSFPSQVDPNIERNITLLHVLLCECMQDLRDLRPPML